MYGYISFYFSIHQLMDIWVVYGIVNKAGLNINVKILVWTCALISLGLYLGVELPGHRVTRFSLFRNCQNVFWRDYSILHCHQQCIMVPISSCSQQCLLSSAFCIITVLVDVKCCLVVLICILLITNNVEH